MQKKMETTIICWDNIRVMEKKMELQGPDVSGKGALGVSQRGTEGSECCLYRCAMLSDEGLHSHMMSCTS